MRRRAEQLLSDIRSLEIHHSSYGDLQNLKQKWKSFANFDGNCSEASCVLRIFSADFVLRHFGAFVKLNALHYFMLTGGRPLQIRGWIALENDLVSGKSFSVAVDVLADKKTEGRFPAYFLGLNAYSVSDFSEIGQRPNPAHPSYLVAKPRDCDGRCRQLDLIFTPAADPDTINRLMQIEPSCLAGWFHPCLTEGDLTPAAWAQYEIDYPGSAK